MFNLQNLALSSCDHLHDLYSPMILNNACSYHHHQGGEWEVVPNAQSVRFKYLLLKRSWVSDDKPSFLVRVLLLSI